MSTSFPNEYTAFLVFVFGGLSWTLLEYGIHRYLGHDARWRPNFFSHEHTRHHSEGNYFSPVWKKLLIALAVLAGLGVSTYVLIDWYGLIYMSGLVCAYLGYERFHYLHHISSGSSSYGRRMRRHHFYHHFSNPRMNHGVTTPLWDLVFGTYASIEHKIKVPRKLSMSWLINPITNEVYPEYSKWYELKGEARKSNPVE